MSYYMGDFYSGDPGFFGGLISAGTRLVRGAIRTVMPGGISTGMFKKAAGPVSEEMVRMGGGGGVIPAARGAIGRIGRGAMATVAKHPVLTAAGAAGTIGILGGMGAGRAGMVPAGQRGMHISRRTGHLVRNRRMRVTNPKALHRAIRRCTGFGRLARKVLRFTSPRPPRGRFTFKTRRRGAARKVC
jgi:hypothetical protein